MGWLDSLRKNKPGTIRVRCGMCKVVTDYPESKRGTFAFHSCDADVLVREPDPACEARALDLFVRAIRGASEIERIAARDRLLYESGEGPIPMLEDLLWRMKYAPREAFPFPELAERAPDAAAMRRIDWSNELEMFLHRMKKFAITRRQLEAVAPSARPILAEKLERLKTDPLVPLEED